MVRRNRVSSFPDFLRQRKEFERILEYALTREEYENFGINWKVTVPKDIRQAYFELFRSIANPESIRHGLFQGDAFLQMQAEIPFHGADSRNVCTDLIYSPTSVVLRFNSYSFQDKQPGNLEAGLFITSPNEEGIFETELRVSHNFKFYGGYAANHTVSETLEKIQTAKVPVIPVIDSSPYYDDNLGLC